MSLFDAQGAGPPTFERLVRDAELEAALAARIGGAEVRVGRGFDADLLGPAPAGASRRRGVIVQVLPIYVAQEPPASFSITTIIRNPIRRKAASGSRASRAYSADQSACGSSGPREKPPEAG